MLNVNPETVCFLIAKARAFHGKEEVVIPDVPDSPADDWARQALADHADDATFMEFKTTIEDLEPDQQQAVVALMWLGRGEFNVEEWEDALQEASDGWTEATAEYLIAHPMLADDLLEGLVLLGYSCEA
ncbi:DUF3775 domain-containing protein [Thiogranum longum]